MNPITLFIVDDHQMVIDGLAALLADEPNISVIGTALNGKELQELLPSTQPDIILLDISMPVMDGKKASRWIKANFPQVKIIILTMHQDLRNIQTLLRIGVNGYLLKGSGKDVLVKAIETVAKGKTFHDDDVFDIIIGGEDPPGGNPDMFRLTPREMEIVCLISKGLRSQDIAEKLFISPQTVLSHRKNILSKGRAYLPITNMTSLTIYLGDRGMLSCGDK